MLSDSFPGVAASSAQGSCLTISWPITNSSVSSLHRLRKEKEASKCKITPAQAKAAFRSQRYLRCAYEATGLNTCLKLYLDELVKEAVSKSQRKEDLRLVVLRMTRLDHMLSQWGDEENSQHARQNIFMFGGAEYYT